MKKIAQMGTRAAFAAIVLGLAWGNLARAQEAILTSPLTVSGSTGLAHVMPLASELNTHAAVGFDSGPLVYHGGPIMPTVTIYPIFWIPSTGKLQNGGSTGFSSKYVSVQINMLNGYVGHGLSSINTQYSQTSPTTFISGRGGLGGYAVDSNPFPASGCTDTATPGNCLTDAQIQTEITNVMTAKGWTGGLNKIFMLFTSSGEGSCYSVGSCAYTVYCAYHGSFGPAATPVIYSNEPYGNTSVCQAPGTPAPSGDAIADAAATAASHELSEAITDPELNAWYTASGNENGDLCAYNYGTNTWDSGLANQMWNGNFYELQMEFDNHISGCAQVGP